MPHLEPRYEVVAGHGSPMRCPGCGRWYDPRDRNYANKGWQRLVICICGAWLQIWYVDYLINELGLPG